MVLGPGLRRARDGPMVDRVRIACGRPNLAAWRGAEIVVSVVRECEKVDRLEADV